MNTKIMAAVIVLLAAATVLFAAPSVDTITAASGSSYYAASSYDNNSLKAAFSSYPYPAAISVSTVNADGSPNIAVAVPGLSADGKYLTFGLADNRTKKNFLERKIAVVMLYEYTPSADKASRNKGCKLVIKYVGDSENERLNKNAGNERPSMFMEIIEILPLG